MKYKETIKNIKAFIDLTDKLFDCQDKEDIYEILSKKYGVILENENILFGNKNEIIMEENVELSERDIEEIFK